MISINEQQQIDFFLVPKLTDHLSEICPEFEFRKSGKTYVSHFHINGSRDKSNSNTSYIYANSLCICESADSSIKKSLISLYMEKCNLDYFSAVNQLCEMCSIDRIFSVKGEYIPQRKTIVPKIEIPQQKQIKYEYLTREECNSKCTLKLNPFTESFLELFRNTEYEMRSKEVLKRFQICTCANDHGDNQFWTCFPYIDQDRNICEVKLMRYNGLKRDKKHISNLSKGILHKTNFERFPCFFGQQFITREKEIVIVESEKTALLMSVRFPDIVCVASGGSSGLNEDRAKHLTGCRVKIYFDEEIPLDVRQAKIQLLKRYCSSVEVPSAEEEYRIKQYGEKADIGDVVIQDMQLKKRPKPTAVTNTQQVQDHLSEINPFCKVLFDKYQFRVVGYSCKLQ